MLSKDNLIITISRQKGSGGHYVGELVAKKLGIKCYDEELIIETAKASGMSENYITKHDEKPAHNIIYFAGQPVPMHLYMEQSKVIRDIAARESCVFVGRCADYVLRDFNNVINVFVTAPLGARIDRVCKREGISVTEAEKLITRIDKERSSYYHFYSQQRLGNCANYQICLDTSRISIDDAVEMIEEYIKRSHTDGIIKSDY
ncbi:MAG: cytidylate kinase-like family protein [Eubacterium sp.]|nr:cytidylate kinase-like family protein [Eubacterium sp.]